MDQPRSPQFAETFLSRADVEAEASAAEDRVRAEVARLGLQAHARELDEVGYTVLAPHMLGCTDIIGALRDKIVEIAGRRAGTPVDVGTGKTHSQIKTAFGQAQWEGALLLEDPMFERVLMQQHTLALITYLLGESCTLNHFSSLVKGPGLDYLPLHADQNQTGAGAPFLPTAQVANATWALTDYTVANGAICFAPGSHKHCRPPTPEEATDLRRFKPLEVPAGSVIVWHGNTWHGALPRTAPGVRVCIVGYFQRWYMAPVDVYKGPAFDAALARHGERFAVLTGASKPANLIDGVRAKAIKLGRFA